MSCQEFVELVTAYLDGTMPAEERSRFEEHLALCPGCATYVEQMRQTVALLGQIPEESISPDAERELLRAFRDWKGTT
ncbi:MAG TPA: zf-HC2 domain-containing protein [Chloroflexota bacterium]|nr:zf-HC2 domain-containing protein [Chloroflexota bacterium]